MQEDGFWEQGGNWADSGMGRGALDGSQGRSDVEDLLIAKIAKKGREGRKEMRGNLIGVLWGLNLWTLRSKLSRLPSMMERNQ